jgi:hypothetical protein
MDIVKLIVEHIFIICVCKVTHVNNIFLVWFPSDLELQFFLDRCMLVHVHPAFEKEYTSSFSSRFVTKNSTDANKADSNSSSKV